MIEHLKRAYAAIGENTPLLRDCGELCAAACCCPDDDGNGGVYLFPGERELLGGCGWGDVVDDAFAPMLVCNAPCDRDRRPLACRIFPLTPVRGKNGLWTVRMDVRARPVCPLVRSGLKGLSPEFVASVRAAIRMIAETPEGDAFLTRWFELEETYRAPIW